MYENTAKCGLDVFGHNFGQDIVSRPVYLSLNPPKVMCLLDGPVTGLRNTRATSS